MQIIAGGTYEKRKYDCMYDVYQISSHQDRYDKKSDLIGIQGFVDTNGTPKGRRPAMLWFSGDNANNLHFEKGERYFPEIDLTYNEIKRDLRYDLGTFQPTDTEGWCMDGLVEYLDSQYGVYVSGWDDTTDTWEEAIIVSLAESLAQNRSKNKSIEEENSGLKTIPPKTKREQAKELCEDYFGWQYLGEHVVLVVWDDPIVKGALSHRSGCFEEFFEAKLFAQALKEEYSKMVRGDGVTKLPKGSHATIYLDGSVYAAI